MGEQTDFFPSLFFYGTLLSVTSEISVGKMFAMMTPWRIDVSKKRQFRNNLPVPDWSATPRS